MDGAEEKEVGWERRQREKQGRRDREKPARVRHEESETARDRDRRDTEVER